MTVNANDYIEIDCKHWLDVPSFSDWYDNFISEAPKQAPQDPDEGVMLAS